jgi:type IV secretion system protein TrbL
MFIKFTRSLTPLLAILLCGMSANALAAPQNHGALASGLMDLFSGESPQHDLIFKAASYLFWSLATIGLVWSMATVLMRRADIGELFFELLRFVVFTGLFFWFLQGVSDSKSDTFLYHIFDSFTKMGGESEAATSLSRPANNVINIGLNIFYRVIDQTQNADANDTLVLAGMSLVILAALTLVAAQMVLVVIMAWMLAYGGIFLLGFGGSRWTSPIAISYFKHALAVGIALLALILLMKFGMDFLKSNAASLMSGAAIEYIDLADVFVIALVMAVLAVKLPGLLYTLVTGSSLGILAGTASMAGTAIVAGGGSAFAAASNAMAQNTVRYENHYTTAVEAAMHASHRDDTLHQPMHTGAHAILAANGSPQFRSEGSVFGGPPSFSAWSQRTTGQSTAQEKQAHSSSSGQAMPGSKIEAGAARMSSLGGSESSMDGKETRGMQHAAIMQRGVDDPLLRAAFGTVPDESGSQGALATPLLTTASSTQASSDGKQPEGLQQVSLAGGSVQSIESTTKSASSSTTLASTGGFQPAALQQPAPGSEQSIELTTKSASSSAMLTSMGGFQPGALQQVVPGSAQSTESTGKATSSNSAHAPSGGFQSVVLQQPASPSTGAAQSQSVGKEGVASLQVTQAPTNGVQPASAPSQSNISMPPRSVPSAQKIDKTAARRIKKKAEKRAVDKHEVKGGDQRKAITDPRKTGGGQRSGSQASMTKPDDEVAAFRDRQSSPTDGDGEEA